MELKTIDGQVHAIAETIEDVRTLLDLGRGVNLTLHTSSAKRECPTCGAKVKYLETHNRVMHGEGRLLGAVRGDVAKRKAACPVCGKRIKQVKAHMKRNHPNA